MRPSAFRLGVEFLESREVPSTVLQGHECLVFYLGGVPGSGESATGAVTTEACTDPAALRRSLVTTLSFDH